MRNTAWMLGTVIAALITTTCVAAAEGEASPGGSEQQQSWARWQGRLALGTTTTAGRLGVDSPAFKLSSASVMGDYYFAPAPAVVGQLGGFRATSGLVIGPRGSLATPPAQASLTSGSMFSVGSRLYGLAPLPYAGDSAGADTATLPYLGVGYTGLSVRSGWSFSADLGLVAQSPGNAGRLGRVLGGGQSLDDVVRDMRLAPLLQLGVSYSF